PSPACITPAFTNSSLYLPISVRSCVSGRTPASVVLSAFNRIMNRILISPFGFELELIDRFSTFPNVWRMKRGQIDRVIDFFVRPCFPWQMVRSRWQNGAKVIWFPQIVGWRLTERQPRPCTLAPAFGQSGGDQHCAEQTHHFSKC